MAEQITPAPAAPAAPEPVAPVTPPAPAAEPPKPVEPSPEEAAQAAEDKEWDDAEDELFPGIKSAKKKGEKDEPAKSGKDAKTPETPKPPENETPEQKAAREAKEAEDAGSESDEPAEPDTTSRDARIAARESAQQLETVKSDVREQMFKDTPQVLQDADGDPIKSIEDVMRLINPRTGEAFTEEEAGMWLLSAQQQFNQNIANIDKQIEQIAEVNMDIKDQADAVGYRYGELLKEMPELRDSLWVEYEKTLVKDDGTGIITKAPVSLESFYNMALKPYVDLADKLEADAATQNPQETPEAKAKVEADAEEAKKKARQDRSDIYGGGKVEDMDDDDKEWSDAATAVFGPKQ